MLFVKKKGFEIKDIYYTRKGQKTSWTKAYNLILIAQGFEIKDIYYTRKGQKTSWTKAYNLILIAQKND